MARAKAYQAQRLKIDGKRRNVLPAFALETVPAKRSLSGRQYVLVMVDVDDDPEKEAWYGCEITADEARKLGKSLLAMADELAQSVAADGEAQS